MGETTSAATIINVDILIVKYLREKWNLYMIELSSTTNTTVIYWCYSYLPYYLLIIWAKYLRKK